MLLWNENLEFFQVVLRSEVPVFVITPTYKRMTQIPDMIRLGQTLKVTLFLGVWFFKNIIYHIYYYFLLSVYFYYILIFHSKIIHFSFNKSKPQISYL